MNGQGSTYAIRYHLNCLVYFEEYPTIEQAIRREKELKKWRRVWKDKLISSRNPEWRTLSL